MLVTVKPRASINAPVDAAASPLPRLETTPPVKNKYFGRRLIWISHQSGSYSSQIGFGINTSYSSLYGTDCDDHAMLEEPKLFQALQGLKGVGGRLKKVSRALLR